MNGLRISLTLLLENAGSQSIRCVLFQNWYRTLQNDGTVVINVIGEMNGAATHLGAAGKHRLMYMMPIETLAAERGNEGGVNIYDAAGKIIRDVKKLKKASHADEVGPGFPT